MRGTRLVCLKGGEPDLTDYTRGLIFRAMDGVQTSEMIFLMSQIHNFTRCDDILSWLIRNKITGYRLINWFKEDCHKSVLEMGSYILSVLKRDAKTPVLYGVDWK